MGNLRDFEEKFSETRKELVAHLRARSLRTDGPFTLRSGELSPWYLDARQTTMDGAGARLVARCLLARLDPAVTAVGGMSMGADPVAVATAVVAAEHGRELRAFSVRKEAKSHGLGGRLVGPVRPGDKAAVVEDTTTTGGALAEAITVAAEAGLDVVQAIAVSDRSEGKVGARLEELGMPFVALTTAADLDAG